jgi:LysM repeat protein
MSMNGLASARWLYVGQVLLLPGAPGPAPQPAQPVPALLPSPPEAALQPGRTQSVNHTVHAGQSVSKVAEQYGVTPAAIARLNGLTIHSVLEVGQTLRIPSEDALELIESMYPRLDPVQYPSSTERWVEVDLSEQLAIAYEGTNPIKAFVISTGVGNTPTVTGTFRIWAKIAMQDMSGGSRAAGNYYHLKDVPNVQFFYRGFGFHGTYWHSNFGTPMSRGCVNMTKEDAKWLFEWTSPAVYDDDYLFSTNANPGTLVMVHQ